MTKMAQRWAYGFVIAAAALSAAAPGLAAKREHISLKAAGEAARRAVLSDSSYRVIDSSQPLRKRVCWRSPGNVVRCSLYRLAATPCALEGGAPPGGLCVQVLARRSWLVEIGPPASPPPVRILRIVDGAG